MWLPAWRKLKMKIYEFQSRYDVHKKITDKQLKNNGFKVFGPHACLSKFVYKDIIKLSIDIDTCDLTYAISVEDIDHNQIFFPIYHWNSGKNKLLEEVENNVQNIFNFLCKEKIMWDKQKNKRKKN